MMLSGSAAVRDAARGWRAIILALFGQNCPVEVGSYEYVFVNH